MSITDLRREFRRLQDDFLGGVVGKMKRQDIEHRMIALKAAMEIKASTPLPEVKVSAGPPGPREVKTKEVVIDEDTKITAPVAPKEGKAHSTQYKKKPKAEVPEPAPVEKPAPKVAEEKPKKVRKMPPKVELKEEKEAEPKPERKKVVRPKPTGKATAAPNTEPPAPEPEPVVAITKMPGGCRPLPESTLHFN